MSKFVAPSFSEAVDIVADLVERFARNLDVYKRPDYKEAHVRVEFIDPFFEALGWDVRNVQGYAEQYKDVIHEDAIKVGGVTRAPDYCFRVGGVRKFFLEAKKPAVAVKGDVGPAYQLRRYAWSAKLPLSILTDFEEFAVYDCRQRPRPTDKVSVGRIMYVTFDQYLDRFDDIYGVFAKESVLKGSFDRYVQDTKRKRGTSEVDAEFLKEIEGWRDALARNIALRNPALSVHELNFAVQRTIDRITFLRMCEDRGVEDYGRLLALTGGPHIYDRLGELYRQADEKYDSDLFDFQADTLSKSLTVDDKVLKPILAGLYYPQSPYEFSVLPTEILGQVYEQFLGKVIRLTPAHRAKVEEKPEVKKAGGVYYTPTYIVDYIVKQTVGQLVEGKTPRQISKLRILDPACGSGSFLLGAYQYLLDYHLQWYEAHDPAKQARGKRPALYQTPSPTLPLAGGGQGGGWRLTTAEKKRILLNNIYGVDIDQQAVEVTKLSLLLKVLEGENQETLGQQLALWRERALPDLGNNIKCGNSLIGPDYFEAQLRPDEEEIRRVNPFDWEAEFPEVMAAGGFDAVIGNPPWGAEFSDPELEYHRQRNREIIVRMIDSFMYFVHQGCRKLKAQGCFGMILPDVVLYQKDNTKLREFILAHFRIQVLMNLGDVFEKVTRPACILILEQGKASKHVIRIADFSGLRKAEKPTAVFDETCFEHLPQDNVLRIPGALFVTEDPARYDIWAQVNSVPHKSLGDVVDEDGIQRGVSPDLKEAFLVDSETARQHNLESAKLRRVLTGGKQVKRYFIDYPDLWLIYTTRKDNFRQLPNIRAYIDQFKNEITCKEVKQNKHPLYSLHRPRKEHIFLKDRKILGVITEDEIVVALDDAQTFATDGLYLFGVREWMNVNYLMGILNSKLFVFVYRLLTLERGRALAQVKPTILRQLPIRTINFDDLADVARHDKMVGLVERMLVLYKKLAAATIPADKELYQRQIEATDRQIDALVYELYGLTEEEIAVGGMKSNAPVAAMSPWPSFAVP